MINIFNNHLRFSQCLSVLKPLAMIHFSQFAFMQIEATIGSAALTGQEVVFMPFFNRKRRLWADPAVGVAFSQNI